MLYVRHVCSHSTFLFSEEFSRVQEESGDKISETSNQPDKTGTIVIYMHIITHTRELIPLCCVSLILLPSAPAESIDAEKLETNSTSFQVKLQYKTWREFYCVCW